MGVAEKIQHIIGEQGLKQKAVAEKAGMSENALSDLLNGRKVFRIEFLIPICKALGTTPDEVLEYQEQEQQE